MGADNSPNTDWSQTLDYLQKAVDAAKRTDCPVSQTVYIRLMNLTTKVMDMAHHKGIV